MSALAFTSFALAALLLAGCAVGPDYRRPAPLGTNAMPVTFAGTTTSNLGDWKPAEPAAQLPRGAWWTILNDAELNRLQTLAATGNQELAVAAARFEQSRALVNVARAGLFPQASALPAYTRQRSSLNLPQNGVPAGASYTYNFFNLPLEAGWEADLWGRVRRQVESARAGLAASADDLAAARLAVEAEIAADYLTLRALDAEYVLLGQTVEAYRRSLELTHNRRRGGVVSDLDVSQAETQLRTTAAQLPVVDLQRVKLRHALATLCGQPATGFALAVRTNALPAVPAVPLLVPGELLERRPDVAAAERRMAAANAEVGVAQTAFYPRLQVGGLAGFQSISASTWFDWPSRAWAVGPSLEWPLFTGGRNRAQLAAARAAYDATVAAYRLTVLNALQEVEDQLAAQRLLAAQADEESAALIAARRTLELADNRYRAGLVTYLEVAVAQSSALTHERTVVQLEAEQLAAGVALIKALGGGWTTNRANR